MIDFVNTPPFLRKALQVAMSTMHFHIAQTGLFMGIFFSHSGDPRKQFGTNSKLSLGCKVGHIRSRGRWFKAEISLFMMFFYDFHLIYKAFINILEYAIEVISYTTTR